MRGGNRGQLSASADFELGIGAGEVDLDRVHRDEQALRDLRVGQALGGEVSDSLLALRETDPAALWALAAAQPAQSVLGRFGERGIRDLGCGGAGLGCAQRTLGGVCGLVGKRWSRWSSTS